MLLSEAVAMIGTPEGNARLKAYLESTPFPHFEAHPKIPKLLVRIDEDGKRTVGRFIGGEFVASESETPDQLNSDREE